MSGPIAITSPFKQLVDGVAAFFVANEITAVVERGWKARAKQINQGPGRANRVIFMPSKADGGAGAIVNPRQVGLIEVGEDPALPEYTIRPLSDWSRSLIVSMWAYDGDSANDEGAQCDAVDALFRWTQIAVQAVAFGNAVWNETKFTVPAERAFGLELLAGLTYQSPVFDMPLEIARPAPLVTKGPLP